MPDLNGSAVPVCLGTLALGLLFALWFTLYQRRQIEAWPDLAAHTGLTFEPAGCLGWRGWPRVHGRYHGRALELSAQGETLTESVVRNTRIGVAVDNPAGASLTLLMAVAPAAGERSRPRGRIQVGDPAFDGTFLVDSQPPELATSLLAAEALRQRLLRLRKGTSVGLWGQELWLERPGVERDVEALQALFDLVCDLADGVEATPYLA